MLACLPRFTQHFRHNLLLLVLLTLASFFVLIYSFCYLIHFLFFHFPSPSLIGFYIFTSVAEDKFEDCFISNLSFFALLIASTLVFFFSPRSYFSGKAEFF